MSSILSFTILMIIGSSYQQSLFEGLVNIAEEGQHQFDTEPQDIQNVLPEYDFIVIGAGTSGCVVTNRLSENPAWKVLLIEAGYNENYLMDMPILANYLQFTDSNWRYKTEPSGKFCMGMDNLQCNYPRGKVVGGSSVLNYMIYTRGNRKDYDLWEELGNTGWSFEKILPYFQKVENFSVPGVEDMSYHGTDGHVSITYSPYKTKIADAFVNGSIAAGFNYIDYNGPNQVGVSRVQVTMKDGVRHSSSRAYLHPIRNRKNFHMKKLSMVKKILIDPVSKKVQGVEFVQRGRTYTVRASKEVIVSAGAINSPQLLMLSGIGPRKHLKQMKIPVVSNLKVGYNLMDHIATGGLTFLINKPYSITTTRMLTLENLKDYLNHHKGPLSVPGGCEILLFTDLEKPNDPNGHPDMELLTIAGSIVSDPVIFKDFGISNSIYDKVYKPIEKNETFMVFPMLMRPKSKGRIMLKNNNYKVKPNIFPNYLAFEEDLDKLVKGIRLTINITQQPAMQEIGAKLHDIPIPQCEKYGFATDDYFKCMTRYFTFTIYHQCGTCKMGPPTDKRAVVDPRLRVYGVEGLRVIDASIIPEIPAAHTNAPSFMIGEKGADMIKEDWATR